MLLASILQRRRPLYVTLSVVMVGLFVLFYGVLATFQYQQGTRRMLATASESARMMARQTEEVINALLKPAETAVTLLAASELPPAAEAGQQARWLRVLSAVLEENRSADAVYVAWGDGSFVLLRPVDTEAARRVFTPPERARWQLQLLDRRGSQAQGGFIFLDAAFATLERRPMTDFGFDPRQRGWYRDALAAAGGAPVRTAPYVYFTTRRWA